MPRLKGHDCELEEENKANMGINVKTWDKIKTRAFKLILVSASNPRSKAFLRSSAAVNFEKKRQMFSRHWYIIHPFSELRSAWELSMCFVLLASLIVIPYDVSFVEVMNVDTEWGWLSAMLTLDMLCILDVIMNFFTGFHQHETKEIVLDPWRISRRYIRGYFFIDLLSSLPFELLNLLTFKSEISGKRDFALKTTIASFSLIKVFRTKTFLLYLCQVCEIMDIRPMSYRLIRLTLIAVIFIHWTACIHFLVPIVWNQENLNSNVMADSWIVRNSLLDADKWTQYRFSIFRAVNNILGTGYGDGPPTRTEDMLVTMVTMVAGAIYNAYLFVVILHIMSSLNASETKYQEIMNQLQEYMRHKQLPMHIQRRLLAYYEYRFQKSYFRENAILATLSELLRQEINMHCCRRLVENVAIFNNLPKPIIAAIVGCLQSEIFLTNDIILKAGAQGDCMYFLASGTVAILTPTGKEVCHLEDGAHFGEIAMVMPDEKRVASVLAVEICELYRLDRRDFQRVITPYPELYARVESIAVERLERTLIMEEQHKKFLHDRSIKTWVR